MVVYHYNPSFPNSIPMLILGAVVASIPVNEHIIINEELTIKNVHSAV